MSPRRFTARLDLPPRPVTLQVRSLTRGRLIAGAVLLPLGLLGTGFGIALVASPTYTIEQDAIRDRLGVTTLVTGGSVLLAGIITLALVRRDGVSMAARSASTEEP